jgi:transposase-like protein
MEIRTGVGRRRRWTAQEKGRVVAEALNSGVPVAEIARRHDMSSQHLFNWIRAAKEGRLVLAAEEGAAFVPVVATSTEMRKAPNAAVVFPVPAVLKAFTAALAKENNSDCEITVATVTEGPDSSDPSVRMDAYIAKRLNRPLDYEDCAFDTAEQTSARRALDDCRRQPCQTPI